jgi:acyl-CoA synthetase (AMP-forming)/AMP-acid ligase II/1-acyl-sn-glycerol-3-phosphate acyltransferase/acyl carrier protein
MLETLRNALRTALSLLGRAILFLRYRVEVRGLAEIRRRGDTGILFLPSHLALIDPIILSVALDPAFHPGSVADEYQISHPLVRFVARLFGARALPNMERQGLVAMEATRTALDETITALRAGENLLFYPAGRLRHGRLEELRAASGTDILVRAAADARVVLVRQTGLWGSSFSRGFTGELPHFWPTVWRGAKRLLLSGLFFAPRRRVLIELVEPEEFPRQAGRMAINRYLEEFYNARAPHNTYVPYTPWEKGSTRELPEPAARRIAGDVTEVPQATRQIVLDELARLTGRTRIGLDDRLAHDLGLDSLAAAELVLWLEKEFGFSVGTPESLVTVSDVVLAASGKGISALEADVRRASGAWIAEGEARHGRVEVAPGQTITEVFLNEAAKGPGRLVLADQPSGEKTYRELITAILLLAPIVGRLPGRYVGIMLPASVGAALFYLAALFAGKTPVMVNWTTGSRNLAHALDLLGVERVITAKAMVSKLATMGVDLSALSDRFLLAEDLRGRMTLPQKLVALVRSYIDWGPLRRAIPPQEAVVLFTSGSESLPKAVPLTHANLLTNIRDTLRIVRIEEPAVLVGMLPPFHSFGITITTILPLCSGLRTVYHPNPTEAAVLARLIEAYGATVLVGTPTFLHGIVRAAQGEQLASLRLAVTGAEKCPEHVYQALRGRCPHAVILEGYGITECSPVVSANRPDHQVPGSIGTLLPSVEGVIVGVEAPRRVPVGASGMLLVRGPSVFNGYLNHTGESPFVEFDGRRWYRTGDLVRQDENGVIFFEGRLKRFVKLGGEMISLPAIESVLAPHFVRESDEGPAIAVESIGAGESPEIVLFTCRPVGRDQVNQWLRDAGLSALHNIRRVISVDALPVLGTGKTDYRGLKEKYELRAET